MLDEFISVYLGAITRWASVEDTTWWSWWCGAERGICFPAFYLRSQAPIPSMTPTAAFIGLSFDQGRGAGAMCLSILTNLLVRHTSYQDKLSTVHRRPSRRTIYRDIVFLGISQPFDIRHLDLPSILYCTQSTIPPSTLIPITSNRCRPSSADSSAPSPPRRPRPPPRPRPREQEPHR